MVEGAYRNSHRHFGPYYDVRRPLAPYTRRSNAYDTDSSATMEELLPHPRPSQMPTQAGRSEGQARGGDEAKTGAAQGFAYLSREVDLVGDWVWEDISPVEPLLAPNPSRSSINLWIGPQGAVAHAHYDGYHNFYVSQREGAAGSRPIPHLIP